MEQLIIWAEAQHHLCCDLLLPKYYGSMLHFHRPSGLTGVIVRCMNCNRLKNLVHLCLWCAVSKLMRMFYCIATEMSSRSNACSEGATDEAGGNLCCTVYVSNWRPVELHCKCSLQLCITSLLPHSSLDVETGQLQLHIIHGVSMFLMAYQHIMRHLLPYSIISCQCALLIICCQTFYHGIWVVKSIGVFQLLMISFDTLKSSFCISSQLFSDFCKVLSI